MLKWKDTPETKKEKKESMALGELKEKNKIFSIKVELSSKEWYFQAF